MKKKLFSLFFIAVISTISYAPYSAPSKEAEIVTRSNGSTYIQCINPGNNCAV